VRSRLIGLAGVVVVFTRASPTTGSGYSRARSTNPSPTTGSG